MEDPEKLLLEMETYAKAAGIALSTLGRLTIGDSRFADRLRRGGGTFKKAKRAREWMAAHPPKPAEKSE
jgi:hypothetical protein